MIRAFAMPASLGEHAEAWLSGRRGDIVPPKPSATVLLTRDSASGPELFLLRRQATMAFAGGMYVFPGGGVDPRDDDASLPWVGPSPEQWAVWLGASPEQARELVCAAVRETFEECGVLLAGPSAGQVVDDVSGDDWEADRQALLSREVALSELLRRRRLVLRSDLLRPWAHWTTPEFEPRRYDTRFFLAGVPGGQRARHVEGGEASQSGWWSAGEVLAGFRAGQVAMLPPTLVGVEEVAAADDVASLTSAPRDVRRVMPWLDQVGDQVRLLAELPG